MQLLLLITDKLTAMQFQQLTVKLSNMSNTTGVKINEIQELQRRFRVNFEAFKGLKR